MFIVVTIRCHRNQRCHHCRRRLHRRHCHCHSATESLSWCFLLTNIGSAWFITKNGWAKSKTTHRKRQPRPPQTPPLPPSPLPFVIVFRFIRHHFRWLTRDFLPFCLFILFSVIYVAAGWLPDWLTDCLTGWRFNLQLNVSASGLVYSMIFRRCLLFTKIHLKNKIMRMMVGLVRSVHFFRCGMKRMTLFCGGRNYALRLYADTNV